MKTREERVFQVVSHVIMILASAACIVPFLLLIISSFTDNNTIVQNGYSFFPEKWGLEAYRYLLQRSDQILRAYGVTVLVTAVGTTGNLFLTTLLAYPLSRVDLPGRKVLSFLVFFTMLFSGGLVPTYLLYTTYLGAGRADRPPAAAQCLLGDDHADLFPEQHPQGHYRIRPDRRGFGTADLF